MSDDEIKATVERVRREMEATKRRHKLELLKHQHELEDARAHCDHKQKRTRSIMGRDTAEWCVVCGKEW
jgi:hypothetical protein